MLADSLISFQPIPKTCSASLNKINVLNDKLEELCEFF